MEMEKEMEKKKGKAAKKADCPTKGVLLLQLEPPVLREIDLSKLVTPTSNYFQVFRAGAATVALPQNQWLINSGFDGQNKLVSSSALLKFIAK